MTAQTVLVNLHIHTDGPIPGPHSLLTLNSAAHLGDGDPIDTFAVNLSELPGATLHPVSFEYWRTRAEDWLSSRRLAQPPALALQSYLRWIGTLPGEAVLVTDPVSDEYLFVFWYSHRYAGQWPFARTSTEPDLLRRLPRPPCSLSGCRKALAQTS